MTPTPLASSLERYMDLLSARQRVAVSNIANSGTPGYKTRDIDFQFEFRAAMDGPPAVVEVPGMKARNDGNNVSLDRESRMLAENAIRFNAASSLIKQQGRLLRMAIEEGRNG
jgi:flagellar basal-body rod protein FlgB